MIGSELHRVSDIQPFNSLADYWKEFPWLRQIVEGIHEVVPSQNDKYGYLLLYKNGSVGVVTEKQRTELPHVRWKTAQLPAQTVFHRQGVRIERIEEKDTETCQLLFETDNHRWTLRV